MTKQITPLRQRMIDDMALRNMSPATQRVYVNADGGCGTAMMRHTVRRKKEAPRRALDLETVGQLRFACSQRKRLRLRAALLPHKGLVWGHRCQGSSSVRVQRQRSSSFVGREDGYELIRGELAIGRGGHRAATLYPVGLLGPEP